MLHSSSIPPTNSPIIDSFVRIGNWSPKDPSNILEPIRTTCHLSFPEFSMKVCLYLQIFTSLHYEELPWVLMQLLGPHDLVGKYPSLSGAFSFDKHSLPWEKYRSYRLPSVVLFWSRSYLSNRVSQPSLNSSFLILISLWTERGFHRPTFLVHLCLNLARKIANSLTGLID